MGVRKEEAANLQRSYPIYVEVGFVLALSLLILAFRADLRPKPGFQLVVEKQEVVQMEEIMQTEQDLRPPPPPRPPIPVEVPDDAIVEDEPVDLDASLDVAATPPPVRSEKEYEEPEIFLVVEERPEIIGGLAALQRAVQYPAFAKRAGIQGTVFVQFVVDEEGRVMRAHVTRSVHPLLDEAALKAIRSVRFKPGRQRGRPVKVQMGLPIRFRMH